MARRLFFVANVSGGTAELCGQEADHLRKVLRAQPGQKCEISDNQRRYLAEIEGFGKQRVRFRVLEELPAEKKLLKLWLGAALFKFDRFELLLEKATELGADWITPVVARRSEKGLDAGARKRRERWERILREASQQCRRTVLPVLEEPTSFENVLSAAPGERFLLDEDPGAAPFLVRAASTCATAAELQLSLLVGPEGGWTPDERQAAAACGWVCVSLGNSILRAETAAAAALAVVGAAWQAVRRDPDFKLDGPQPRQAPSLHGSL